MAASHVGPFGGGRVVVVAHAVRHVVRPLALVRAAVGVEREALPGAPPLLEAALVAAARREPQRAAPMPLVVQLVALVLVAARQARDAPPRAHAARELAVVPLAIDADVAAAPVRAQRLVELAVVLGAVRPAVDALGQPVVGPLALDLAGRGVRGTGRSRVRVG